MKEKNATLLSKEVAVKSWSGGALLYVPIDHENAPGQAQPGASIMALSNTELINLIAWKRQRDGARHAPDDLAEQIVAGLVNREISPRSAVEAIRWIESNAADGAIAGWIESGDCEAREVAWARYDLAAEDATRLSFEEWAEIHGNGRS
jgi:hypothetical protein